MSGRPRSSTMQSNGRGPQRRQRLGGRADGGGAGRRRRRSRRRCCSRSSSLSSTTRSFLTRRSTKPLMPAKASSSDCWLTGFFRKAKAPSFMPALPAVVDRDDVDGDVAGARVVLEAVEDHPAVHVGQPEVERDGVGLELAAPAPGPSRRTR